MFFKAAVLALFAGLLATVSAMPAPDTETHSLDKRFFFGTSSFCIASHTCKSGPANSYAKCVLFKCQYACNHGYYYEHGLCKPVVTCDPAQCQTTKPLFATRGYCHENKCAFDCPSYLVKDTYTNTCKCSDSKCHSLKPASALSGYCHKTTPGLCDYSCPSHAPVKRDGGCYAH